MKNKKIVYCTCCKRCNPLPRVYTPEEIKAAKDRREAKEEAWAEETGYYRKKALKRVMDEADFRRKHVTLC